MLFRSTIFGSVGKLITSIIIMISAFGCANGMIMAGARVYYKMAKDRLFFRSLAVINRRTKVPVNSLWLQCAWISALILWGNYTQLLDFVIFASLIFYVITIGGVFVHRKKFPDTDKALRVNNFYAISFIVSAIYIIGCLILNKPQYTLPGLLITLAGLPVYFLWNRARKQPVVAKVSSVRDEEKPELEVANK